MPSAFNVTTPTNDLKLPDSRQGVVALTVSNISGKAQDGRLSLAALDPTRAAWLGVVGDMKRSFPVGGAAEFAVQIAVPKDATPGRYTYRPDVVAVANPDEDSTQGPTLAFEVPKAAIVKDPWWKTYRWAIAAAAAAALIVIAVLAYLLVFRGVPETVWVDDALPAGATPGADGGDAWTWVTANPSPFSGTQAHQSNLWSAEHQHFFSGATAPLGVNPGDSFFAYVYLDAATPPSEVMLQWFDGASWDHRAIWGADQMAWGVAGQPSRYNAGPLPAKGQWVRLEVPAAQVGLEGRTVSGMAFTLFGGRATWDRAGILHGSR